MDEKMKKTINQILSDDMLSTVNGGFSGSIDGNYPEPDVEEVKSTMKSVAASFNRELAIEIGMQLLNCSREEAERILDEE